MQQDRLNDSQSIKLTFSKGSLFSFMFREVQCLMMKTPGNKQASKYTYIKKNNKINNRETQRNHMNSKLMSQKHKVNENQWVFISEALEICQTKIVIQLEALFACELLGHKLLLLEEQKQYGKIAYATVSGESFCGQATNTA